MTMAIASNAVATFASRAFHLIFWLSKQEDFGVKIVQKIRENRGSKICFFCVKKLPLRSQSPLRFHYQKRTCNGCLPYGKRVAFDGSKSGGCFLNVYRLMLNEEGWKINTAECLRGRRGFRIFESTRRYFHSLQKNIQASLILFHSFIRIFVEDKCGKTPSSPYLMWKVACNW